MMVNGATPLFHFRVLHHVELDIPAGHAGEGQDPLGAVQFYMIRGDAGRPLDRTLEIPFRFNPVRVICPRGELRPHPFGTVAAVLRKCGIIIKNIPRDRCLLRRERREWQCHHEYEQERQNHVQEFFHAYLISRTPSRGGAEPSNCIFPILPQRQNEGQS